MQLMCTGVSASSPVTVILLLLTAIVCIACTQSFKQGLGPLAEKCILKQMAQGDNVVPLLELETSVKGCSSRNVSAKSQEVHAIKVGQVGPSTGTLPSVRLLVKPRLERSAHAGPLVLVLGSPGPVRWRMTTERLPNSSRVEAFVSSGSEVVAPPNIQLETTIKNLKFEELLTSVESQYHVLTSYSLVQFASSVILKVGVDEREQRACNKSASTTRMKHVESFFVLPQPIRICDRQDTSRNASKVIYVINLASSMGRDSVVVQLVSRGGIRLEKDYVLALKCQSKLVRWEVESAAGIQGTVEIVTENSVTSEATSYQLSVIVRTIALPDNQDSLLKHVKDSVGIPDSYIETEGASRIQVLVDSEEKVKSLMWNEKLPQSMNLGSLLPGWLPAHITHEETKLYKEKAHAEVRMHSGFTVETSRSWKPQEEHQENVSGMPNKASKITVDTFAQEIIVACTEDKMFASIPVTTVDAILNATLSQTVPFRETFPARQYVRDVTLTLRDSRCVARRNATHYLFVSFLNSCGGEANDLAFPVTRSHQQVQVWLPAHHKRSAPSTFAKGIYKHFERDDEDADEDGSGSMGADGNLGEHLLSVDIWCPLDNSSLGSTDLDSSDTKEDMFVPPLYQVDLYLNPEYTRHISAAEFPVSVPVNSVIYSHLGIPNIPAFCITIDECWLTNATHLAPRQGPKWTIVKNNCPAQIGVTIQHADDLSASVDAHMPCWKRFSFVLDEDFIGQSVYLSCLLSACVSSAMQGSEAGCHASEQQCERQSVKSYLVKSAGKYGSLKTLGPIHVLSQMEMDAVTGTSQRRPHFLNPFAKQYIVETKNTSVPHLLPPPVSTVATSRTHPNAALRPDSAPSRLPVIVVGVVVEAVVGIALSSFAIGVALVAAIWYIHSRTSPHRRRLVRYQAASTRPHPCSLPPVPHNLPVMVAMPLQPSI